MIAGIVAAVKSAPVILWVIIGIIVVLKVWNWWLKLRGRV